MTSERLSDSPEFAASRDAGTTTVIGGGLAGLTTAVALARRGVSVVMIKEPRSDIEATKACHGISTIKGILESDAELFALKQEGHRGFAGWLSGLEAVIGEERPKSAWLEGVTEYFPRRDEFQKEFGRIYRRDFIGAKRVALAWGDQDLFAKAFYPGDWWIDPSYLVGVLARVAKTQNVRMISSEVTSLQLNADGVRILTTTAGEFLTHQAIICAGAGSTAILERSNLRGPALFAVPGYTYKATQSGEDVCCVKGTSGVTRRDDTLHWGSTSDSAQLIQGETDLRALRNRSADEEYKIGQEYLARLIDTQRAGALSDVDVRWGVRVRTRSRGPVFQRVTDHAAGAVWLNAGYYKSGIILSWLMAERFAEQMAARS